MALLTTIDGVEVGDCGNVFVVREVPEIRIEELKILANVFDLYRDKGYYFFSTRQAAEEYFRLGNSNLL